MSCELLQSIWKLHTWTYPNYSTKILRKLGDPYAPRFCASFHLSVIPSIIRNYCFLIIYAAVSIIIVPY